MAEKDQSAIVTADTPDIPRPAVGREPKEKGATGTQNFGGVITGEEYNAKLQPPQCWDIFDEMRKSDPQVQASLEICKAPLTSATFKVQAPADATPQEQEVADFCQRALFERGAMVDPWEYTLEHALLQLDFGVMVFEKVWQLAEDQKIRLNRLAPRMPRTIQKWNPAPNGQLESIQQYVIKDGKYQSIPLLASDLAWSVRKQEGDNFWGVSLLRSAYKDWYYKTQAEKADATRIYRYGVGIPMAVRDKEYSYSEGEEAAVQQTLKRLSSHERSYIQTHSAITFSILTPTGSGGDVKVKEKIDGHNKMIVRNVLADFMSDTPDGLNSGRTRTLADIFTSCLYASANRICGMVDLMVIRPMCVWNFSMKGLRFPTLVANDVTDVDVKMMADVLARLGAMKFITADDDLEGLLREMLGMPPLPAFLARPKERPQPPQIPQPGGGNNNPPPKNNPPEPSENLEEVKARHRHALRNARPGIALKASDRKYTLNGRDYCRPPTAFELKVLSIDSVPDRLQQAADELARDLRDIRRQQLAKLAAQIAKKDARESTGEFTDIRPSEFNVSMKGDVKRVIKTTLTAMATFGAEQVVIEIERQAATENDVSDNDVVAFRRLRTSRILFLRRGVEAEYFDSIFQLAAADKNKSIAKSALTTSAQIATEQETDAWFNRILDVAIQQRRGGTQGEALEQAIIDALTPQLESGLQSMARAEVNEAFGIGRATEATALKDQIGEVEYSCLLDVNSCDPCIEEDGKTFEYGSADYYRTLPPFKDCEGNRGRPGACRCVHLYHLKG